MRIKHRCINCLEYFAGQDLSTEHVIPSALGGCLKLNNAACEPCNNDFLNKFDSFLSNDFPPTKLARTDLAISSSYRPKVKPTTSVQIEDKVLGQIEGQLNPPGEEHEITFKKPVKRIGQELYAFGSDFQSALRALSKARKIDIDPKDIDASGEIIADNVKLGPINWDYAKLAAAKILYEYLLLELGEGIFELEPIIALRNYLDSSTTIGIDVEISIENQILIDDGKIEIPRHHHVIMFDSDYPKPCYVCLFGIFSFKFTIDLSLLSPHGRLIGIDPVRSKIVESCTMHDDVWRFRKSHNFGWWKRTGERETPFIRNKS